jgi:anti-anti-sigma factor
MPTKFLAFRHLASDLSSVTIQSECQALTLKGDMGRAVNTGASSRHAAFLQPQEDQRPGPMDFASADCVQKSLTSIDRRTKTMMLTRMIDEKTEQVIIVAESQNGRGIAASLELSHRILPTGETAARIGGELDIATADMAVRFVTRLIDRHPGPVVVDLAALSFCDARGLSALLRMASYAERAGHSFRLASPSAMLVKLVRIGKLDHLMSPSLGGTG